MSQRPSVDFNEILSQSGIPTTQREFEARLKEKVMGAGSSISNDSEMSPFWRWVRAAVITPTVWLVEVLLAGVVMPNMFVATAARWALELKAWELNVRIKGPVKTQGYITFTKTDAGSAVTLSKGLIIQTLPIDDVIYKVQVLEDTLIDVEVEKGAVFVEALDAGVAYNLSAGYFNLLPEPVSGILSAVNEPDWITRLGADDESDDELASRLQNAFNSAGSWHIDDVYRSIIASVAGIQSDNIFFENTGHINPGSATAFILMAVGPTPSAILDKLNHYIMDEGNHGHGDVLICQSIPDVMYAMSVEVVLENNLTQEEKTVELLNVEDRIRAAFRETDAFKEMTRAGPLSRFSLSRMASEIHQNMERVVSVKVIVNGNIQEDILSEYDQPRLTSLLISDVVTDG